MSSRWSLLNLACNLVAGVPAVVPLRLAAYWAANFPLAALDLSLRNPTENDGMLPVLVVPGPI